MKQNKDILGLRYGLTALTAVISFADCSDSARPSFCKCKNNKLVKSYKEQSFLKETLYESWKTDLLLMPFWVWGQNICNIYLIK